MCRKENFIKNEKKTKLNIFPSKTTRVLVLILPILKEHYVLINDRVDVMILLIN